MIIWAKQNSFPRLTYPLDFTKFPCIQIPKNIPPSQTLTVMDGMIDQALAGLDRFVYLDNIIIFGSTIQEHNRNFATIPTYERNPTKITTRQM